MEKRKINIYDIDYYIPFTNRQTKHKKSISVIGIDTETLPSGRCFLISTSLGDNFSLDTFPKGLFTRKYRNKIFVAFNLKFDEGSLLQNLPFKKLNELRIDNKTEYKGYIYKSINRKFLSITKRKNSITFYDISQFYKFMSLNFAAEKFLGKSKLDIETKNFTNKYIQYHFKEIIKYCIQDALLAKELADLIISQFESFGVYPQKLYSTAYISFQYFRNNCNIPIIQDLYDNHKELLQFALRSYTGGKFEVTEKGIDNYYEYDIVSAYPYEIANLVNIQNARIVCQTKYIKSAVYGFINCIINIPAEIFSPIALKYKHVNVYPIGKFESVITKKEYEYLLSVGCDISIIKAYWFICAAKEYPFKKEINKLLKRKSNIDKHKYPTEYMLIKTLLNSLYGKFIQLIEKNGRYIAGLNWNIIYGTVITANCRVRVTELQQKYSSIVAVHTDSVISTKRLPALNNKGFGNFTFETSGKGLILGSGIYQIGDKVKFRGFDKSINLFDLCKVEQSKYKVPITRALSWRLCVFHGWNTKDINKFTNEIRKINISFDIKRNWIDDWKLFSDIKKRKVYSVPRYYNKNLGLF